MVCLSCFNNGHYKYYNELWYIAPWEKCYFLAVLFVIGIIEHRGWCSPKGKGSVIALVKIPCEYIYIYDHGDGTHIPT